MVAMEVMEAPCIWLSFIHLASGREHTMHLMGDGHVQFNDGRIHGAWGEDNGAIIMNWHCKGVEAKMKCHRYVQIANTQVWQLKQRDAWFVPAAQASLLISTMNA